MSQAIALPGSRQKSTRDEIIGLLSEKWPLSAKEIFSSLKREGFNGTYQAVHKSIMQALAEGVLEKDGKNYKLNEQWIKEVKNFGAAYSGESYSLTELVKKDIFNKSFDSMIAVGRFAVQYFTKYPNPEKKPLVIRWRHMWPIITLSEEEYIYCENFIRANTVYALTGFDNPLDRLSIDAFKDYGCKIKIGSEFRWNPDVLVMGDYIAHIYFGDAVKMWDDICGKMRDLKDVNLPNFYRITFGTKVKTHIMIVKNPEVAEMLRRETIGEFNGGKN